MARIELIAGGSVVGGGSLLGGGLFLPTLLRTVDDEIPETVDEFKKVSWDERCVSSLFPRSSNATIDWTSVSSIDTTGSSGDGSSTASPFLGENKKVRKIPADSCLVVNWDKKNYKVSESDKWKGSLRFLWSVRRENSGFVVFLVGTTNNTSSNQSIKWTGLAYTLKKEKKGGEGSEQWEIKNKKEIQTSDNKEFKKNSDAQEANKKSFPRAGKKMDLEGNPEFWGFFEKEDDLEKICSDSECTDDKQSENTTTFKGYWEWRTVRDGSKAKGSEENPVMSDWTQDLDRWWRSTFEQKNQGNKFKVSQLADKEQGYWSKFSSSLVTTDTAKPKEKPK